MMLGKEIKLLLFFWIFYEIKVTLSQHSSAQCFILEMLKSFINGSRSNHAQAGAIG